MNKDIVEKQKKLTYYPDTYPIDGSYQPIMFTRGCGCCEKNIVPEDFGTVNEALEFIIFMKDKVSKGFDIITEEIKEYFKKQS